MARKKQKTTGAKNQAAAAKEIVHENNERHIIVFAFLAVSVFLAYSNSLNGTWALDDTKFVRSASLENYLNLRLGYRKIAFLTFLFNKWINPFSVVNFRVTNIIIHIINSVLVYWISIVTLRLPKMRERFGKYGYPVALITATVFALHPININAVAYIVQRMTSLSAFFVLLSLLSYLHARTASALRLSLTLYVSAAVFILLGIFSKENAVLALPLFVLYDYFFISEVGKRAHLFKVVALVCAGLAVITVSLVYLNFLKATGNLFRLFLNINQQIPPLGWTTPDVYWTPLQHIMTEFRVVGRYFVLLLAPLPDLLVFDKSGISLSASMIEPLSTLFSFLVIAGLIIFSVLIAGKMPFVSFGLLWYLMALSLESFIGIGLDLYFEHRNYLPSAGLFLGISAQMTVSIRSSILRGKNLWAVVLIIAVLLGGLTFRRNYVWKDSVTLWTDTLVKDPGNIRAMVALGKAFMKSADFVSAGKYYNMAMDLSFAKQRVQYFNDSAYSLGMISLFIGNLEQAKKVIDLMDKRLADGYTTEILKGYYSSLSGDTDGALRLFNHVLPRSSVPDRVITYTLIGDTYKRTGYAGRALENYKKAVELDPSFSAAYFGMGDMYFAMKDINNAEKYISRTLLLDPANPLALARMADILLVKKEPPEKAKTYAERAVSSFPVFHQPYATMATVLIVMGREEEAEEYFKKAYERGLRGYLLPYTKARAYFIKGDKDKAEAVLLEIANMDDAPDDLRNIIKKDQDKLLSR
jgi:tetratricopeptide (TPR) repeat protein